MSDATVVVPTRNRGHLLHTTLRTVLGQVGVAVEVIVVDDASTSEGTTAVVTQLADSRVRLVRHTTCQGPNAARNTGARAARSEWLAFVDDDDMWAPDKLRRQLAAAEATGRNWVYAGSVNVDEQLNVVHGTRPLPPEQVVRALPRYNAIPASASNVSVRRAAFLAAEGFDEALRACEEWDLWLRLLDREGPPAWVDAPLVAYRMHPGNSVLDVGAILDGARTIERLHGTPVDWGRLHRWLAQLSLRGGDRAGALGHYGRAVLRGGARDTGADLLALGWRRLRKPLGRSSARRRSDESWEDLATAWIDGLRPESPRPPDPV